MPPPAGHSLRNSFALYHQIGAAFTPYGWPTSGALAPSEVLRPALRRWIVTGRAGPIGAEGTLVFSSDPQGFASDNAKTPTPLGGTEGPKCALSVAVPSSRTKFPLLPG